ncbi:MAG: hypothetical protein JJV89_03985 [Desulfosarcina sp.]|nr:hypothetical protein [Desulfobacterales bacterium]
MKQLTQKLKNGKMQIQDTSLPSLQNGHVLVKNHYSLLSVQGLKEALLRLPERNILMRLKV